MADDIRRRAERDANELRRDAAEWASATRRQAEQYRDRILAQVDVLASDLTEAGAGDEPRHDHPETHRGEREREGEVIDLRQAVEARRGSAPAAEGRETHDADLDDDGAAERHGADRDAEPEVAYDHRRAMGGTYVVGRPRPAVETSIDTKLNDVVRQVVRRTFNRSYP